MLTGVPCSAASRAIRAGSSELTSLVGPGSVPGPNRPPDSRAVRSTRAAPSSTGRRPSAPAGRAPDAARARRAQHRDAAASAPALAIVRTGSVTARRAARRRAGRGSGRAVTGTPKRNGFTEPQCPTGRRSLDTGREESRGEDLVDRPWAHVLPAGARHPGVPGPPPPLVERVPAQLRVAGRRLPVVLAEGRGLQPHRGVTGGGGGRRRPSRPARKPTPSRTPPTSRLIDPCPRSLLGGAPTVTRHAAPRGAQVLPNRARPDRPGTADHGD